MQPANLDLPPANQQDLNIRSTPREEMDLYPLDTFPYEFPGREMMVGGDHDRTRQPIDPLPADDAHSPEDVVRGEDKPLEQNPSDNGGRWAERPGHDAARRNGITLS